MTAGRVVWVDYTNTERYGVLVRLSARMEDGRKFNGYVRGTEPYIFAPEDETVPNKEYINYTERGYNSLFDHKLQKITTETPKQAGGLKDNFSWTGEADVPYYRRVAIHDGLSGYIDIPETDEMYDGLPLISIEDIDIDIDYEDEIKPRISISDIEVHVPEGGSFDEMTENGSEPINVICSYDTYEEQCKVFFFDKYGSLNQEHIRSGIEEQLEGTDIEEYASVDAELISCGSEVGMLNEYIEYVNEKDFDLISGWNYVSFDRTYIRRRMRELRSKGENIHPAHLSPFNVTSNSHDEHRKIVGRVPFDMLEAFCDKLTFSNWRSRALEYVANKELGVGKIDEVDINDDWKHQPSRLIAYNIVDVILTVALDDANDIHNFFYELADECSIPIYDTFYEKRLVDGYVMSRRGEKEILPTADESELIENAGGYVDDPVNGRHEKIGVSDLKSLYPSAMITWNISTETIAPEPDDFDDYVKVPKVPEPKNVDGKIEEDAIDMDWLYCSLDEEGIIPRTLKQLFQKRDHEKSRRNEHDPDSSKYDKWDRKQAATKVIMNCFDGDTELVTPDGIRNIGDVEVGDDVYSINPDTQDVEVKEVVDTTEEKNVYGEIEHVTSLRMDQKITKNHKVLTEEEGLVEYRDLEGDYTVPNHNPVKDGRSPDYFDIVSRGWVDEGRLWLAFSEHGRTFKQKLPAEVSEQLVLDRNRGEYRLDDLDVYRKHSKAILSISESVKVQYSDKHGWIPVLYEAESFIELVGWFIAEGHCYSDKRTAANIVHLAQKTQPGIDKIQNCLERCGLSYSQGINGFTVSSTPLYNLLKDLCGNGSYEKEIPEFVFNLDYKLRDLFWGTLMDGDGNEIGDFQRYSTASDNLKDDVCRLLVLQGWQPQVRTDSGVWRIQKSDGTEFSTEETETEKHEEKVYCVTVEDNHTVLAGRNGKFSWIGQSFYGNASSKYWRLANEYLGDAITSTARYTLWKGRVSIEKMGKEAAYGDTDSHFIRLESDTLDEQIQELKRVSKQMDEDASTIAQDIGIEGKHPYLMESDLHGDDHTCMVWEPEKIYETWMQLGKKKRYAGKILWEEGNFYDNKISISGFEFRRSDSMEITAELQQEVIEKILTGSDFEGVSEYIQSMIDQIDKNHEDVKKFALPGSINKALEDYPNRQVPRASMYSNEHLGYEFGEGDDPFVYMVKDTPSTLPNTDVVALKWNEEIPEGFELDREAIIERGIKKPIETIIGEMDWKFNEIRSGKKQKTGDLTGTSENPFAD